MSISGDDPLDPGRYQAILRSLEEKETIFGQRLMWVFEEQEDGVEVAGFSSLSSSVQANSYKWAIALNPKIAGQRSWTDEDVVGRAATLELEIVEGAQRLKNKIVQVLPAEEPDLGW